jgi:nucleobase:cation symporter-1, NCS1 family
MTTAVAVHQHKRRWVENRHIEYIPADARHGKPWQQFFFWFGANVNVFNVVLGGVAVSDLKLPFWWALLAITAGTLIGALLIALHASQGPKLGVPQTIQTRAQLGYYGAAFMFAAVLALNIGFVAAELVIQAQAMTGVTTALSMPEWIIVLAVPSALVGILGYRWIHRVMQATALIVGVTLVIMLVQGLHHALPASETTLARPSAATFAAGVALLVIDMLSFGPFTADYSRYLPAKTSPWRLILANYTGNILATIASCAVGAYLAALLPNLGAVGAVGQISGKWALVIMAFSLLNANAFNAYTGSFQVLSLASMSGRLWRRVRAESVTVRVIPFLAVLVAGTVIACWGYQQFVTNLGNFLDDLLILLIPWSAVNLTDYFLVRRGKYDVASFFTPDGIYGRFAWRGLLAYLIGLVAELPFAAQPDYTGWLVKPLGGADISWLVGWIVAAGAYLLLAPGMPQLSRPGRPAAAPAG